VKRVERLSLRKNVMLVGERPHSDLVHWYNAADVFALASLREGSPNVFFEAMACGVPVVTTSAGDAPEVVASERFGLLAERTSHALASALSRALSHPWDRAAITAHAAAHDWNQVALRTLRVYDDVLNRRQRSRCTTNEL
jgi:glycosyltransferase involved in cell wall biosynthesis